MRTTLDLPQDIVDKALKATHCRTKTEVITVALNNLINREQVRRLKNFRGKVKLDIDLAALRSR